MVLETNWPIPLSASLLNFVALRRWRQQQLSPLYFQTRPATIGERTGNRNPGRPLSDFLFEVQSDREALFFAGHPNLPGCLVRLAGDGCSADEKNGDQDRFEYNRSRHEESLRNRESGLPGLSRPSTDQVQSNLAQVELHRDSTIQTTRTLLINQIRLRQRQREIETSTSQTN
jgi:hypothetical protein